MDYRRDVLVGPVEISIGKTKPGTFIPGFSL
jgi:hypothetical protein